MKAAPPESLSGALSDYRCCAQHFREGKGAADKPEFELAELGSIILVNFRSANDCRVARTGGQTVQEADACQSEKSADLRRRRNFPAAATAYVYNSK
jgi:hypothetical protein